MGTPTVSAIGSSDKQFVNWIIGRAEQKEKVQQGEIPAETLTQTADKNPEKIMLFTKMEVARQVANQPIILKPIKETVEAAAVSTNLQSNSIWNNNQHTNFSGNIGSWLLGGTTLASALKEPENNQGSNSDKKDSKNAFLSAKKNILDVRMEQLDKDILNIMGGIC